MNIILILIFRFNSLILISLGVISWLLIYLFFLYFENYGGLDDVMKLCICLIF